MVTSYFLKSHSINLLISKDHKFGNTNAFHVNDNKIKKLIKLV